MTELLKSKPLTDPMKQDLERRVDELKKKGCFPTMAILRIGDSPDDIAYERSAIKNAEKLGIEVKTCSLEGHIDQDEVLCEIDNINSDTEVHGALILRPFPEHLDDDIIRNRLAPEKDIDGITDAASAMIYDGKRQNGPYPPCTAEACINMLDGYGIDIEGKNTVVIGRSNVIGKPVAMMLLKRNATVTICHSKTRNLSDITKNADIVVAASGRMASLTKEYMNQSQIILDVGIHFDDEGQMCGDTVIDHADGLVRAVTPVPGGVGGMTNTVLCQHVIIAAENQ